MTVKRALGDPGGGLTDGSYKATRKCLPTGAVGKPLGSSFDVSDRSRGKVSR